jgi:hypothetical protein
MITMTQIKRTQEKIKSRLIRFWGLKGSWSWAKRKMMNGSVVRCKHWSGNLILKIDSPKNTLLQACFSRTIPLKWETSTHHLVYELFTDYCIFEGNQKDIACRRNINKDKRAGQVSQA